MSQVHQPSKQWPPTEFNLAGDVLPQISQIDTDGLGAEDSSGGILASATAKCLPQIAQIYTEVRLPSGGKTRKQYALKGQKHIAQGNALGKYAPH